MSRLALIMVGDELLDGRVAESNSRFLIEEVAAMRGRVVSLEVVADDQGRIAEALDRACKRASAVVVSGGLGPTPDDLTREALAQFAGEELVLDDELVATLTARFESRGRHMTSNNLQQAMRTPTGRSIPNPIGSAPGLWHEVGDVAVILVPGVPSEMRRMWSDSVREMLRPRLGGQAPARIRLRVLRTAESTLAQRVVKAVDAHDGIEVAFCVHDFGVDVLAVGSSPDQDLTSVRDELKHMIGDRIYAEEGVSLPDVILDSLRSRGETLAAAESCTGGLLSKVMTDAPGSSDVFVGAVVAYSNAVKTNQLGVPAVLVQEHGAVSEPVALAMARGVRDRLDADWGVSITGVAGPGGGTEDKPVGTVWLGLSHSQGERALELRLPGDRDQNRQWAVGSALGLLFEQIRSQAR